MLTVKLEAYQFPHDESGALLYAGRFSSLVGQERDLCGLEEETVEEADVGTILASSWHCGSCDPREKTRTDAEQSQHHEARYASRRVKAKYRSSVSRRAIY
jgi:hypothetical protein